jgi:serine O-acetyltransferase
MGFSAYGVTQGDDPVALAMKGLIDHAAGHEHQISLLWKAIEQLSRGDEGGDTTGGAPSRVLPLDAQTGEHFDAERLNQLVK